MSFNLTLEEIKQEIEHEILELPPVTHAIALAQEGLFIQDQPNNPDQDLSYYFPEED